MGSAFDVNSFDPLTSNYKICAEYSSVLEGELLYAHCLVVYIGRYVCIYLTGESVPLHVCEVEVYETPGEIIFCYSKRSEYQCSRA